MENFFNGAMPFGFGANTAVPGPPQISPLMKQQAQQQGMYQLGYALLNKNNKKKKSPLPMPTPMMMNMLRSAYYNNQGMPGTQEGMGSYYNDFQG